MKMDSTRTVYLVIAIDENTGGCGGDEVVSVWSSPERAQEAADKWAKKDRMIRTCVEAFTVNE